MTTSIIKSDYLSHTQAEVFLGSNGLPTRKTTGYKFTPLSRMLPESLTTFKKANEIESIPVWNDSYISFNNGELIESQCKLPEGVELVEIAKDAFHIEIKNSLQAINLLTSKKFYQLNIAKNTSVPKLKIQFSNNYSEETNCDGISLSVKIGENSKLGLFESIISNGSTQSLTNSFLIYKLGKNATLNHYALTEGTEESSIINNRKVSLAEAANYKGTFFDGSLGYNRNDLEVILVEKSSHADIYGLYALKDKQFSDNFINVHHQAADSTSNQLFKGILKGHSRAIFTGKVLVDAGANQVNSSQLNKNIILDNTAQIHTEPQLEVYTDDVKCGHGATVGQLSDEEIFYLESRGISKEKAFKMLCQAYADEILMSIDCDELKNYFHNKLHDHFDFSSMAEKLFEGKK